MSKSLNAEKDSVKTESFSVDSTIETDVNRISENQVSGDTFVKPDNCSPTACATCPSACGCGAQGAELDTSQGEFRTIGVAILGAILVYAIFVIVTGKRLGDYPGVLVYGIFLALVIVFWILAERFLAGWRRMHPGVKSLQEDRKPIE